MNQTKTCRLASTLIDNSFSMSSTLITQICCRFCRKSLRKRQCVCFFTLFEANAFFIYRTAQYLSTSRWRISQSNQFKFFRWWMVFKPLPDDISVQRSFTKIYTPSCASWLQNYSIWSGSVCTDSTYCYNSNISLLSITKLNKCEMFPSETRTVVRFVKPLLNCWILIFDSACRDGVNLTKSEVTFFSLPYPLRFFVFWGFLVRFLGKVMGPFIYSGVKIFYTFNSSKSIYHMIQWMPLRSTHFTSLNWTEHSFCTSFERK